MSCVFCADLSNAGGLVHEDEVSWVLLHPDWSPRGHAMIVAKRHVENVADLEDDEWLQFARTWRRAERVLLDATNADRAIILKLGILTPHLHVHIYPVSAQATREDVFEAIDGKKSEPKDAGFISLVRSGMATES